MRYAIYNYSIRKKYDKAYSRVLILADNDDVQILNLRSLPLKAGDAPFPHLQGDVVGPAVFSLAPNTA